MRCGCWGVITVVAAPVVWWKLGWQSAVLLLVGGGDLGVGAVGVAAADERGDGADGWRGEGEADGDGLVRVLRAVGADRGAALC